MIWLGCLTHRGLLRSRLTEVGPSQQTAPIRFSVSAYAACAGTVVRQLRFPDAVPAVDRALNRVGLLPDRSRNALVASNAEHQTVQTSSQQRPSCDGITRRSLVSRLFRRFNSRGDISRDMAMRNRRCLKSCKTHAGRRHGAYLCGSILRGGSCRDTTLLDARTCKSRSYPN
ncbi:hypothetical protein QO002_005716 [Pararhizobium capsulatum DSM 1112]|uniref:Uncharacterized protein n=1 Tax=Pararhizobium capsulatum DSM 1112 TaxID=1121113 RepID=A0ABU0C1G0_9HYPH|nr:hypothetical protein [Pararhizobium capsulatum DSM 1112]